MQYWLFPHSESPTTPETLLSEWERRVKLVFADGYTHVRSQFLEHFRLLCAILQPTADVNVDEEDIRTVLFGSSSLQIGSACASGPGRAVRAAQAALETCQLHCLGPLPDQPATVVLLSVASSSHAELEMDELTGITEYLQAQIGQQAEVLFGHELRDGLAEELQVCLLLGYGSLITSAPTPRPELPPEEVFLAAVQLITTHQKVNGNMLQRHLGLGYNRTYQLLQELEAAGVIRQREVGGYVVVTHGV